MNKKNNPLMDRTKETMGVGVASMAGLGAMGAMSNIPGMPAQAGNVIQTAGAGFSMIGVGQTAKNAMTIVDMVGGQTKSSKVKDERLRKMLGK